MKSLGDPSLPEAGPSYPPQTFRRQLGNVILHLMDREGKLGKTRQAALERLYLRGDLFIVQIGANSGGPTDPLFPFFEHHPDAKALVVEPQTTPFNYLKRNHDQHPNVSCVQIAIAANDEFIDIWRPKQKGVWVNNWGSEVASLNPLHMQRVVRWHPLRRLFGYDAQSEKVRGWTVDTLFASFGLEPEAVTAFVCDTEGSDRMVVERLLDAGARPTVLQYEHLHTTPDERIGLTGRLGALGYTLASNFKDTLAIRP